MLLSGMILPTCLLTLALLWAYAPRLADGALLLRLRNGVAATPILVWIFLGVTAFILPVLEYWITAKSHGNALAGFLPWADATEYYQCSEVFLLGLDGPAHCAKRPYYFAFFADLLWLTGNRLQFALLLQALILGAVAALFVCQVSRTLNTPAALAAYSVFFAYAAALCSGLVMTENIGLVLGTLGILLLWQYARTSSPLLFVCAIAILAAAMSARPGPLFVLPALLLWYLVRAQGSPRTRLTWTITAGLAAALAMMFVASPILIAGGSFGSTHSNFSYSLYGLVAGGKGWLQVTLDHPEIFNRSDGISQTDKVYQLAFESLREKPHLFVLGYLKGIAKYFDALFRYTSDFKPLRLGLLLPLWVFGAWYALRRWRKPSYSMLLAVLAGIIVSSPFLIYDAHNRAFASTVAVDALLVALGMVWICEQLKWCVARTPLNVAYLANTKGLVAIGLTVLFAPVVMFAAIRPTSAPVALKPPECVEGQIAVALRLSQETLVLPLVAPGKEQIYPLAVRADHFGERFHKWVHSKGELRGEPGTTLVWGMRLEEQSGAAMSFFRWNSSPSSGKENLQFCINPPRSGHKIGTAAAKK